MTKLISLIVRYPRWLIGGNILLTILFLLNFGSLHWETDARVFFPKGHPAIEYDEKVEKIFGFKDTIVVGIINEKDTIFNKKTLARMARITDKISMLPEIISIRKSDVSSLSTVKTFTATEDLIESKLLMEKVPETEREIEELMKKIIDNRELLIGNLLSADNTATVIRAKIKEGINQRYQVFFKIKKILQEELPDGSDQSFWSGEPLFVGNDQFYIAGRPVIEVTSGLYARKDMAVMIPLVMIVVIIVIYVIFQSSWGVLLPVYVLLSSVIWTLGFMALVGAPLYITSSMIPVILLVIATADSIHILCKYFDELDENMMEEREDVIYRVLAQIGPPILMTSLTTAAGFLSLMFIEMPPIRDFGIYTGVGIIFSLIISFTMIPSVLLLIKVEHKRPDINKASFYYKISELMERFGTMVINQYKILAVIIVSALIVFGFGASKVYIDSSWIGDFKEDSEVSISNKILNEKFTGTVFLNVIFEGKEPDAMKSPEILAKIEKLQRHMGWNESVGGSLSVVDFLKNMNQTLHEGNPEYKVLPNSRISIGQYLYLYFLSPNPDLLDEVIDYDYQRANLVFAIKTDHTRELQEIIDEVKQFINDNFDSSDNLEINLAGSANNSALWTGFLFKGILTGLIFSKLMIFFMMSIQYRSFIGGLIGILPISITTLLAFGLMGFLDIPLDASTGMAALIAVGVGLDITIHYIYRFQIETKYLGYTYEPATITTFRFSGRAIFFNILVVGLGFMVLALSNFPPHAKMGYFVALYLGLSFLVALVSLPLIFKLLKPTFLEKEIFFCPRDQW